MSVTVVRLPGRFFTTSRMPLCACLVSSICSRSVDAPLVVCFFYRVTGSNSNYILLTISLEQTDRQTQTDGKQGPRRGFPQQLSFEASSRATPPFAWVLGCGPNQSQVLSSTPNTNTGTISAQRLLRPKERPPSQTELTPSPRRAGSIRFS